MKTETTLVHHESGFTVPMRAIWIVYLSVFMDTLGGQISGPVMPHYAKSFGVGNAAVGYLYSAFQLTGIFCAPLLGQLSDRFGRRPVLLASLVGAGFASLGQAFAPSFTILLGMRAFGGIWGAVMPVAKVYVADACSPGALAQNIAYLSSVPGAAQVFGSSFGGSLSAFGLNSPLVLDCLLSFLISILIYFYLPESPAWLEGRRTQSRDSSTSVPIPRSAYLMGISSFLFSMGFSGTNAMLPIVLNAKYGFDPVKVGYTFTAIAIMRLIAGIWISVPLQRHLGTSYATALGAFITGSCLIIAVWVDTVWLCVAALSLSRMGSNIRTSAQGSLIAAITGPKNRGKLFAIIQTCTHGGKLVGPIIGGHLAEIDAAAFPLIFSGLALVTCALFDALVKPGNSDRPLESASEMGVVRHRQPK